jgi:hypothetical protein
MIVVADSGPLHYLILLEQIELLPRFYGQVLVPEPVAGELSAAGAPEVRARLDHESGLRSVSGSRPPSPGSSERNRRRFSSDWTIVSSNGFVDSQGRVHPLDPSFS